MRSAYKDLHDALEAMELHDCLRWKASGQVTVGKLRSSAFWFIHYSGLEIELRAVTHKDMVYFIRVQ